MAKKSKTINNIRKNEFKIEDIRFNVFNTLVSIVKENGGSVSIPKGFINDVQYNDDIVNIIGDVYFYYDELYGLTEIINSGLDDCLEFVYQHRLCDDDIVIPTDDMIVIAKIVAYLVENNIK